MKVIQISEVNYANNCCWKALFDYSKSPQKSEAILVDYIAIGKTKRLKL